jgi:hypothetical protein
MNLYEQFHTINRQCERRGFTDEERNSILTLCVYGCIDLFAVVQATVPFRNHVLTSTNTAGYLSTGASPSQPT